MTASSPTDQLDEVRYNEIAENASNEAQYHVARECCESQPGRGAMTLLNVRR